MHGGSARRLAWLPNGLTLIRLAGIPALLVVAATAKGPTSPTVAFLFGGIAATDWLDGWLARRLHAESDFGRIADPAVDRLLVVAGLVAVLLLGRLHPIGPALLIGREVLAVGGFLVAARMGVVMRVDLAGKASSALAMTATGGVLLFSAAWADVLFWVSVVFAMATLVHYSWRARSLFTSPESAPSDD